MVYFRIAKPKRSDKYVRLEIIDHHSVTSIVMSEKTALSLLSLKGDIESAIAQIGDKIVRE